MKQQVTLFEFLKLERSRSDRLKILNNRSIELITKRDQGIISKETCRKEICKLKQELRLYKGGDAVWCEVTEATHTILSHTYCPNLELLRRLGKISNRKKQLEVAEKYHNKNKFRFIRAIISGGLLLRTDFIKIQLVFDNLDNGIPVFDTYYSKL